MARMGMVMHRPASSRVGGQLTAVLLAALLLTVAYGRVDRYRWGRILRRLQGSWGLASSPRPSEYSGLRPLYTNST